MTRIHSHPGRRERGFSLIEVMIAIVVLSFGLLALAALQSSLFRAGAESKARANALAMAQQVVEDAKTFAYVVPPDSTYPVDDTYEGLATGTVTSSTMGGVTFHGCRQVVTYRYNGTAFAALNTISYTTDPVTGAVTSCSSTGTVSSPVPSVPEFKQVKVAVTWAGSDNEARRVEVTDSVASIAPADSIQVVRTPNTTSRAPEVWILPPGQGNPGVVPIAIGTSPDGSEMGAASSNPKPERFVQGVSSVTTFSVQTFTGAADAVEVRLNRKVDVAAASCVCNTTATVSTSTSPAYQPTVWNGKLLAYQEPDLAPVGKAIGIPSSSTDPQIKSLCTACCRDHHDAASQARRVDPWRLASGAHGHFGYRRSGQNYDLSQGLFAVGTQTNNEYIEACRLVRVNGRMRVAIDAMQNHLAVTPLNSVATGFENTGFVDQYSDFVSDYVNFAAQNVPTGYPAPTAKLPAPTQAQLDGYPGVVSPSTLDFTAASETRQLVTYGLYVDYLSAETLQAYECARNNDNTGSCLGLGTRNPLEYIPFYAVNTANLGNWESAKTDVATVTDVGFSNQGYQVTDGGRVTSQANNSDDEFPVTMEIRNSNTGLTNTWAIDDDDALDASVVGDAQNFRKQGLAGEPSYRYVYLRPRVIEPGIRNIGNLLAVSSACSKVNASPDYWRCQYNANVTSSLQVTMSGYTTQGGGQNGTVTDRQVCLPGAQTGTPTFSQVTTGTGTGETTTLSFSNLGSLSWDLSFDIVLQSSSCQGNLTITQAN